MVQELVGAPASGQTGSVAGDPGLLQGSSRASNSPVERSGFEGFLDDDPDECWSRSWWWSWFESIKGKFERNPKNDHHGRFYVSIHVSKPLNPVGAELMEDMESASPPWIGSRGRSRTPRRLAGVHVRQAEKPGHSARTNGLVSKMQDNIKEYQIISYSISYEIISYHI